MAQGGQRRALEDAIGGIGKLPLGSCGGEKAAGAERRGRRCYVDQHVGVAAEQLSGAVFSTAATQRSPSKLLPRRSSSGWHQQSSTLPASMAPDG